MSAQRGRRGWNREPEFQNGSREAQIAGAASLSKELSRGMRKAVKPHCGFGEPRQHHHSLKEMSTSARSLVMCIANDVNVLDDNQAAAHHFIKSRQQLIDLLGPIHDLDFFGKVAR